MDLSTILASVRRNPLGALLIMVQVAITLTILLNAAGIVQQHAQRMASVSGLDEPNVFTMVNRWVGQRPDGRALVSRDLAVIRGTPGVQAAVSTNGVPLSGRGWGVRVSQKPVDPNAQGDLTRSQLYYLDEHGAEAMGLKLHKGRWFTAEDMPTGESQDKGGLALLTQTLADHLFPGQDAIGKVVYTTEQPLTVIGILETLQISSPGSPDIPLETGGYSLVMPQRMWMPVTNNYIVRARPGTLTATMKEVERRLREADGLRVITEMRTFADTRVDAYRGNRTLTAILVTVSGLLTLVTALGITGLASYWVAQRQRMIGVRRALGARRVDILAYFHCENLLIVGLGTLLGVALAVVLNSLLVKAGVPPISTGWVWGGAAGVLVIGQLAVLVPALRAIRVPPALVMRSG